MNVDFKNAAERHYRDGELLYQNSRWLNADQLFGLSAECVLKRIIVGLDPSGVDSITGDFSNPRHRKHFEHGNSSKDLWCYFSVNFSGRLAQHHAPPSLNPFSDWHIAQRYVHDNEIDQQRVDSHRAAAGQLQRFLQSLLIDRAIT